MATFEHIVSAATLDVVVPTTALGFPSEDAPTDKWLERLDSDNVDRKLAFFDEHLEFLLLLRLEPPLSESLDDPSHPPVSLLAFLAHLQVSYDASYISPIAITPAPAVGLAPAPSGRLSAPPRSTSLKPRAHVPPSIFPPTTPNPTPATTEGDRRYVRAEGTLLAAGAWGEVRDAAGQGRDERSEGREAFALLWDAVRRQWVAVYRMCVNVAFLRLYISDPLLCLTVSVTLREKPVQVTPARRPLSALIAAAGGLPTSPVSGTMPGAEDADDDDAFSGSHGLEEVNLLEGLMAAPSFAVNAPSPLSMPSTRLGPRTRRQEFGLPPAARQSAPNSATLVTPTTTAHSTLRRSFRKTLETVSGFRVRMRTVFVPYVLLPPPDAPSSSTHSKSNGITAPDDEDPDELEAGNTERTVVLCIELENAGESGLGFAIEDITVRIGGESARARLVPWIGRAAFPLRMAPMEQVNVLYAVEFLASPLPEREELVLGGAGLRALPEAELQRSVTINVHGRPFEVTDGKAFASDGDDAKIVYPTHVFASRWNCVLDLSPQRNRASLTRSLALETGSGSPAPGSVAEREALPEPASPFPTATPQTAMAFAAQQRLSVPGPAPTGARAVAGSKRYTLPTAGTRPKAAPNFRASSFLSPSQRDSLPYPGSAGPSPLSKSYTPPSIAIQAYARTPTTPLTTFAPPTPGAPSFGFGGGGGGSGMPPPAPLSPMLPTSEQDAGFAPPPTPAYPAYPAAPPGTPRAQGPVAAWGGSVGPAVDIPRSRSAGASLPSAGVPSTPGPHVGGGMVASPGGAGEGEGQKVVVSVGLLGGQRRVFPHEQFTLDIFVFNQSAWTRRFEVGCPERRRRREGGRGARGAAGPGVVPLENRVRVGPLRPSTCQSVRMDFLALTPGLHSIDTLTLTDIETGYAMNLRSVMDIVVHEPHER